jgi:hypothetical protein
VEVLQVAFTWLEPYLQDRPGGIVDYILKVSLFGIIFLIV